MNVLLDTNLLIEPPRLDRLGTTEDVSFFTSAVCYAELEEGVFATDPKRALDAALQVAEARALCGPGLEFGDREATVYRVVCGAVARSGRGVGRARRTDLMIAATALSHGMTLATRNVRDFAPVVGVLDVIEL